mmetsp:Transcript_7903/g.19588  ORF Transcript_7903/g.19588 Transcript_7903/m.19588 type:complete len:463 (+) Transcript_7903:350-1738(+)
MVLRLAWLALPYCLTSAALEGGSIAGDRHVADAGGHAAPADCGAREMQLLGISFYSVVDSMHGQGHQGTSPIFGVAARCVALEREALGRKTASETAKSLKRELGCWRNLTSQAARVTSTSSLQLPDGSRVSFRSFWQSKRLEVLRDHTALSSVGALWYRSWRLGIVNSTNIDKHVKMAEKGLEDPAFRCQSRWWHAFDSRHEVLSGSLWKRYAELLVAMQSLGAAGIVETFDVASSLPDNEQQWQAPQALHAQLPGLRAKPLWDKNEFPWLLKLEAKFPEVQRELVNAIRTTGLIPNPDGFLHDRSNDWKFLALLLNGQWNAQVCRHLTPVTCSLLQSRPEFSSEHIKVPDMVQKAVAEGGFKFKRPVAMIKLYDLQPGAWLRPHFGSHGRLAAHLGLVVPGACCSLTVGGQQTAWEEGKVIVFDDTFVHEARNTGDKPRLVLGMFFVHPDLQDSGARHTEL